MTISWKEVMKKLELWPIYFLEGNSER